MAERVQSSAVGQPDIERSSSHGTASLWILYGATWLVSLIGLLAFRAARLELGEPVFFILIITLGTLFSGWLAQRAPGETTRLIFGFLDATLALLAITAQPYLNALVKIPTDPSVEIYLSTSLLWYLTLRTPLMVSPLSALFQNVPVMALFGLIGSYLFAPAVPYLFLAFVVVLLVVLMVTHQLELRVQLPFALVGRAALIGGLVATVLASLLAFLLWFSLGELVSGMVIGLPFRTGRGSSNAPMLPALQVGTGPVARGDMEVMRVRFLRGDARYLRMDAYDFYTGRGWNRTRLGVRLVEPDEQGGFTIYSDLPDYLRIHQVHAEITIMGGIHQHFYTPGIPLWLKPKEPRRAIGYAHATSTIWVRRPLSPGAQYEIQAIVLPKDPTLLRGLNAGTPFWTAWSESSRNPRVFELVRRLTADQPTDYDKVLALKRYIETHAVYNTQTEAYPPDVDVVEHFLFVARQGYCTEFATALAVMCQYAGLPARVVQGYLLQERDPQTGAYIVRDRDHHLWTEVYFENLGWIPFDATENVPEADPSALSDSNSQADWARAHPLYRWRRLLDSLILMGVLYLVWSLLVAPRLAQRQAVPVGNQLYARLVYLLRLMGCPPPLPSQSPGDYLRACVGAPRACWRSAEAAATATTTLQALAETLPRLLYAPPAETASLEQEVRGKIKALQRLLHQQMGTIRLIGRSIRLMCELFNKPSEQPNHGSQVF
jgi:transglutaminase-like putative cysteine protease